jgi:hypothetical protein
MAGGANKEFIRRGLRFLQDNIIEVAVQASQLERIATSHQDGNRATLAQRGRVANRDVAAGGNAAAGIYDFDLFRMPTRGLLNGQPGTSIPVYQLKEWGTKTRDQRMDTNAATNTFTITYKTPKYAHPIRAYWVPWSSGSCWSVQLGDDADFFFTPTMDGCSLAISSGRSPIVTHGNYKKLADPTRASESRTIQMMSDHHQNTLGSDVNRVLGKKTYVATHAQKTQGLNNLVTVVGFRDTVTGNWSFYWQRRRVDATNPNIGPVLLDRAVVI